MDAKGIQIKQNTQFFKYNYDVECNDQGFKNEAIGKGNK